MFRKIKEWWRNREPIPLDGHGVRPTSPRPLPVRLKSARDEPVRRRAPRKIVIVVTLVSGCARSPALKPGCPTLITYSAADQKALKTELDAHPELTEVHRWLRGYVGLRDQSRQCAVAR